ncbi:MAG: MurR/RpiR family transcriptional regulator [Peptostreptococcaceae bacterium]
MSILIKLRDLKTIPEAENQVRIYIIKNPKNILHMTTADIAKETFTSPATVVRLCKRINSGGFNSLKLKIAREIESFENHNLELLDTTIILKNDSTQNIVEKVTNIHVKSIEETNLLINIETIDIVAKLIKKAKVLDFYGIGSSHIIALDAMHKFMRVGKQVSNHALYDRQFVQALCSEESHLAIIFSYSGESKEMIAIANKLIENNVIIVSVTSSEVNTLAKLANHNLTVSKKETIFRSGAIASRTASLYVVDILYTVYCNLEYNKTTEMIAKTRISNK